MHNTNLLILGWTPPLSGALILGSFQRWFWSSLWRYRRDPLFSFPCALLHLPFRQTGFAFLFTSRLLASFFTGITSILLFIGVMGRRLRDYRTEDGKERKEETFMQNQGCEGPCADYYQAKPQHSNLKTRYLLALWSWWVKFLVSSPVKVHQFKRVTEQATWRLAGIVCAYMHFQYTKDKISRYQILAQDLRLIYQIIISRSISFFSFSISLTTFFSPCKIESGRKDRGDKTTTPKRKRTLPSSTCQRQQMNSTFI